MSHIGINILTRNGDLPHREWGFASPGMGMCLIGNGMCLTGNGMCLTGNGDVPHREWDVPHREWDVPHRECTSSRGMGMFLTENAHLHWESISSLQSETDLYLRL